MTINDKYLGGLALSNPYLLITTLKIRDEAILESGEMRKIIMKQVSLSNQGGLISLPDDRGNKVDGVSYTREQARKKGELAIFR